MDSLFYLMQQNWVGILVGVVGVVLTILSSITAYVFYRRSRPQPRLAYQFDSYQFPGRTRTPSEEIEIIFRGKRVGQVTKSLLAIWNYGNTTLEREQIVDKDPLRIVASLESEILDVTILRVTRGVNGFSAERIADAPNEIECRFDWLDAGDGALIQILHTGEKLITVTGTLRGVPTGVLNLGGLARPTAKPPNKFEIFMTFLGYIGIAVMMFGFAFVLGPIVLVKGLRQYSTERTGWVEIVLGLVVLFGLPTLLGSLLPSLWRKPPRTLRLKDGDW